MISAIAVCIFGGTLISNKVMMCTTLAPTRYNRCNPYRIKAHASNVIELGFETLESTATIIAKVATSIASGITTTAGYAVGQREVDASRLP
jgi:hypothetical protein